MRGPLFPLRGILGHDSRSPSLSCSPSLPRNFSGASPFWAGSVQGWAPQSPAASGRVQSPAPRDGPGAGAPADPARRPPGRSDRPRPPLQVRREDSEARKFVPPPALYPAFSATPLGWGALATLCALVTLGGGAARPFHRGNFLPPAAGDRGLRCAGASAPPDTGDVLVLGVFLHGCLSVSASICLSL